VQDIDGQARPNRAAFRCVRRPQRMPTVLLSLFCIRYLCILQARTRHKWSFVKQLDAHEQATRASGLSLPAALSCSPTAPAPRLDRVLRRNDARMHAVTGSA
jgi:hypothetical protein